MGKDTIKIVSDGQTILTWIISQILFRQGYYLVYGYYLAISIIKINIKKESFSPNFRFHMIITYMKCSCSTAVIKKSENIHYGWRRWSASFWGISHWFFTETLCPTKQTSKDNIGGRGQPQKLFPSLVSSTKHATKNWHIIIRVTGIYYLIPL